MPFGAVTWLNRACYSVRMGLSINNLRIDRLLMSPSGLHSSNVVRGKLPPTNRSFTQSSHLSVIQLYTILIFAKSIWWSIREGHNFGLPAFRLNFYLRVHSHCHSARFLVQILEWGVVLLEMAFALYTAPAVSSLPQFFLLRCVFYVSQMLLGCKVQCLKALAVWPEPIK